MDPGHDPGHGQIIKLLFFLLFYVTVDKPFRDKGRFINLLFQQFRFVFGSKI